MPPVMLLVPVLVRFGGPIAPDTRLAWEAAVVPALSGLELMPSTVDGSFVGRTLELTLMLVAAAGGSGRGRGVEMVLWRLIGD